MRKLCCLFVFAVSIIYSSSGQKGPVQKAKYYEAWISLNNQDKAIRGILYEINDSSVLITGNYSGYISTNGEELSEFRYCDIEIINIRRLKSITRGTLIGASVGAGAGMIIGIDMMGGAVLMFAGAPLIFVMTPPAVVGAGTGLLLGSVKDRIPIKMDIDRFNLYRSTLQTYSFLHEPTKVIKQFEHKAFAGASFGFAFPSEDEAGTGFSSNIMFGYRFTRSLGVSFSEVIYKYTNGSRYPKNHWQLSGVMAGPIISLPINDQLKFDFIPSLGYSDAYLTIEENEEKYGTGLGMSFNASLVVNFSKRAGLIAETGYYSSRIKYENGTREVKSILFLNLGMVYRFSRKSL